MIIQNFKYELRNGMATVLAEISWEDSKQRNCEIYFSISEEFHEAFNLNPDAFLVACCLPAMYEGEKRLKVDAPISSKLREGLEKNMLIFQKWYGRNRYHPVTIDADTRTSEVTQNGKKHVGLFFSGGIDSLFSLRANRLAYPLGHQASIKDCLLIYGFDIPLNDKNDQKSEIFKRAYEAAKKVTQDASANLIPVFTNIRILDCMPEFWPYWFHGAALASVGHCFAARLKSIHIASSFEPVWNNAPANKEPWGSHPDTDPNYSSNELTIIHDELCSRLEKFKLISEWEIALQNIRSCYQNHEEFLNCCRCEKCISAMVMLLTLNKLQDTQAFPIHEVTARQLKDVLWNQKEADFKAMYLALVPFLKKYGHNDLAQVIMDECKLKAKIRRFDIQYLGKKLIRANACFDNSIIKKTKDFLKMASRY